MSECYTDASHLAEIYINFTLSCNESISDGKESGKSPSDPPHPTTVPLYRVTKINILFGNSNIEKWTQSLHFFLVRTAEQMTKHKGLWQNPCSHEFNLLSIKDS